MSYFKKGGLFKMKKSTKFVSLLLSVMLAVSTFAGVAVLPVNAADGEQRIYFRFPDDSVWRHEGLNVKVLLYTNLK